MNCQWFDSKLESYFCDELAEGERQVFQEHLSSCEDCRQRVESFKEIDPLVRRVFRRRMTMAQTVAQSNPRPRLFKLGMAVTGLAAAGVLFVMGLKFIADTPIPAPPVAVQPSPVLIQPEVKKDSSELSEPSLLKPGGTADKPAPQPELDAALAGGPDFAITDAAGYTATLETYRGKVLLFGVVGPDEKAAIANLQQLYDAFGANPAVRIFAVARHREDQFNGVSFPVLFNNGSNLLGVKDGGFLLADTTGKSKLEGSLADSATVARVKTQLGQLSIR